MPCHFPMQAYYYLRADGKRDIKFSSALARAFYEGANLKKLHEGRQENVMSIPCGYCLGCRMEKSRQWAIRCVHEAKMHSSNCFLTLTYSPEHLPKRASLDKKAMPLFNKRLRKFAIPKQIRTGRKNSDLRKLWVKENPVKFFYCGEYGGEFGRPHYHSLVFNFDFADKKYWKTVKGIKYFISDDLQELWPFGFSTIGSVTFNSAAYVARYSLKKVYGDKAYEHYLRVCPETGQEYHLEKEFAQAANRGGGIGKTWFDKYALTDLIPHDSVVSRGKECKVPRYYDKLWERLDAQSFLKAKEQRRLKQLDSDGEDQTFSRLQARLRCQEARVKLLIRTMET